VLARQPHHQSRHWATASELPTVTIQGRPAPATAAGPPGRRNPGVGQPTAAVSAR
jgi:hypothetical protein